MSYYRVLRAYFELLTCYSCINKGSKVIRDKDILLTTKIDQILTLGKSSMYDEQDQWIVEFTFIYEISVSPLKLWVQFQLMARYSWYNLYVMICGCLTTDWLHCFFLLLLFHPALNWLSQYSWNVVESGNKYLLPLPLLCMQLVPNTSCITRLLFNNYF